MPAVPGTRARSKSPAGPATTNSEQNRGLRRVGITLMLIALGGGCVEIFVPGGLVSQTNRQVADASAVLSATLPAPTLLPRPLPPC
jgi:hypothetical protein